MTNGKHGAHFLDEKGNFKTRELVSGKVVERTGAGDLFAAGFLGAVIHGESLETAMSWGSVNAASVVGQVGAEAGLLTKEKMQEKLQIL